MLVKIQFALKTNTFASFWKKEADTIVFSAASPKKKGCGLVNKMIVFTMRATTVCKKKRSNVLLIT